MTTAEALRGSGCLEASEEGRAAKTKGAIERKVEDEAG